MKDIIYATGMTEDGDVLLGGIWTLWHQDGFPIEMSHLTVRDMPGYKIDWAEAMFDASRTDNCPALMDHIQNFLDADFVLGLKMGFMQAAQCGKTWAQLVADKRANGAAFVEHAALALRNFNEKTTHAHVH